MIDTHETRYDRQERIWWWDQEALLKSRVLVVGAGALGNELVKNLVLAGVGQIDVVDMDRIENSNLARCVFFRPEDTGRLKAEILAERATALNPDSTVRSICDTVQSLGSAMPLDYDIILAGLDNREARRWVGACCRRLGRFWIDGAIEGLQGLVRVFGPGAACYECTLSERDLEALNHRRSCALLSSADVASGRTPTNATTASVVAGLQVQEAIKYLAGHADLMSLVGKVWRMEGETMLTSVTEYVEDPYCPAHFEITVSSDSPMKITALRDVLAVATAAGDVDAIDVYDDLVHIGMCSACSDGAESTPDVWGLRSLLPSGAAACSRCDAERPVESRTSLAPDHSWLDVPADQWVWGASEVVTVRSGDTNWHVAVKGQR